MPETDLSELVAGRSEDLGVEYKAWMDTSQPEVRAKLARHIAALANHGGGYLIFGVDDKTRQPQGATELDAVLFSQDAISAIVKRYLEPRIQIRVDHVEHAGVPYPVVIVPSHDARPVITVNDGPQDDKGRPVGVRQGAIYIRAAGPESVQIKHADDWNTLLERCLHAAPFAGNRSTNTISTACPSIASNSIGCFNWARTLPCDVPFRPSDAFYRCQFSVDCTITMFG